MQESLRTLLNAIPKFEVIEAQPEGRLPVEYIAEGEPDLVLLDFGLPAPQVIQNLAWIKANWISARSLVLANTARQQLAAKAAGADEVLLKGFSVAEFFASIHGLLAGKVPGLEFCDPKVANAAAETGSPERRVGFPDEPFVTTQSFVF
jgi:DNA-binding NarL/FixJ family response regulator